MVSVGIFFFNDTATTEIYTLSLHDALPIWLEKLNANLRLDSALAVDVVAAQLGAELVLLAIGKIGRAHV